MYLFSAAFNHYAMYLAVNTASLKVKPFTI